jgi:hypothetical protein
MSVNVGGEEDTIEIMVEDESLEDSAVTEVVIEEECLDQTVMLCDNTMPPEEVKHHKQDESRKKPFHEDESVSLTELQMRKKALRSELKRQDIMTSEVTDCSLRDQSSSDISTSHKTGQAETTHSKKSGVVKTLKTGLRKTAVSKKPETPPSKKKRPAETLKTEPAISPVSRKTGSREPSLLKRMGRSETLKMELAEPPLLKKAGLIETLKTDPEEITPSRKAETLKTGPVETQKKNEPAQDPVSKQTDPVTNSDGAKRDDNKKNLLFEVQQKQKELLMLRQRALESMIELCKNQKAGKPTVRYSKHKQRFP